MTAQTEARWIQRDADAFEHELASDAHWRFNEYEPAPPHEAEPEPQWSADLAAQHGPWEAYYAGRETGHWRRLTDYCATCGATRSNAGYRQCERIAEINYDATHDYSERRESFDAWRMCGDELTLTTVESVRPGHCRTCGASPMFGRDRPCIGFEGVTCTGKTWREWYMAWLDQKGSA